MSEFPALRDALVRAAERRRRRRRAVGASVPAFTAAAAAVAILLPGTAPEREEVVASAVEAYSVFSRPETDADRALPEQLASAFAGGHPTLIRHVGGGAFALATSTGSVCVVLRDGDQITGSCAPAEQARDGSLRLAARTGRLLALLLPDGTRDVTTAFARRVREHVPIRDNAALIAIPESITALSWTSADGVRHVHRSGESTRMIVHRCPRAVGELPPDAEAQAARIALNLVDGLHPSATTARVAGTALTATTPCRRIVPGRSVAVTLTTDRTPRDLLVQLAVIDGRLQVYDVIGRP